MEFDIVFLSMTRSNALRGQTEKEQRRKYGFLMLPNRLCVAMSRQRRLLAVVGDLSMCSESGADTAIPGLVAFKELCDGSPGGLIDG
jgi:superfamily I DNA and/or RNA helicase